jgi:DNA modification methylase
LIEQDFAQETKINNHVAESYTGIYSMHKYWSKKPFNIINTFIMKYSKNGEIVVDPFCGYGTAITESIFNNRRAVGIDINPIAIFLTEQMLAKISSIQLEKEYEKLKSACKSEIDSYYLVKREDKEFVGTHYLWENGTLTEVWYHDEKGKIISKPNEDDLRLATSFAYEKIPYYYPKANFFRNSRINVEREKHVYDLFTPRNLQALSLLLHNIEQVQNSEIRDTLKVCFTAAVGQASRMVFVVKNRGKFNKSLKESNKKEVGSWVIGYWVPKENFEINVWNCFINKYRKILKAKKAQKNTKYTLEPAKSFEEIGQNKKNVLLLCDSAAKALQGVPDNSVDYVITDPPHGNRMPFLEQSMMWNGWLRKDVNYEDEIVISDSPDRKKGIDDYYRLLAIVFQNIERILKPNKHFSLIFNSLDDETWINLVKLLNSLKLDLVSIETLGYSANSVVQDNRNGGLKTDFIFTYKKNPLRVEEPIKLFSVKEHRDFFVNIIDKYISDAENGLEIYQILNKLINGLLSQGIFFELSDILQIIRTEYVNIGKKWVREDKK